MNATANNRAKITLAVPVAPAMATPAAVREDINKSNPLVCTNRDCAGRGMKLVTETRVTRTRYNQDAQAVTRVRKCQYCGREWGTIEIRQ